MPKNHPARGYYHPKTYMFYITLSDKSFYDLENPQGLSTSANYLVEPIAVDSLAEAQLVLDEIKQRSLVSCDGALHTYRSRRLKPLSIKVFGYRYTDQHKKVSKAKRKQAMGNALARHLYDTYKDNVDIIANKQYNLCDNHIVPRKDLVDFTEVVFDNLKGGGAR